MDAGSPIKGSFTDNAPAMMKNKTFSNPPRVFYLMTVSFIIPYVCNLPIKLSECAVPLLHMGVTS